MESSYSSFFFSFIDASNTWLDHPDELFEGLGDDGPGEHSGGAEHDVVGPILDRGLLVGANVAAVGLLVEALLHGGVHQALGGVQTIHVGVAVVFQL